MSKYDVIVVGSGAGGGIAAGMLAEGGKSVLLLERGKLLDFDGVGRDHLRNQRVSQYGTSAGPAREGNPRVVVDTHGRVAIADPTHWQYQNVAGCVGSGTLVYGAQAWRFSPQDFRMASTYGVPAGSSLADWPITYEELAPSYESIEWEMGVCGDVNDIDETRPRHRQYPMPPLPMTARGKVYREAAARLGWRTQYAPLLINSVPYNGRGACVYCQHCVGFACPSDAKNGSKNTLIARGLTTGRLILEPDAMAERIETDTSGRATGVAYWNADGIRTVAMSSVVVVSGGAIESARLLLNSRSAAHPNGLGNDTDQVGRHIQGHYYANAFGWTDEALWDGIGPGISTATTKFNHGNDGIIGGGMLADDFVVLPIAFVKRHVPDFVPKWGAAHKSWMRHNFSRILQIMGPIQEVPSPDGRVTIDPDVRDKWGIPVPRLSGTTHPETLKIFEFMNGRAEDWLRAAGARDIRRTQTDLLLSAGQHQAGTCRMGDDPANSVTDRWGQVHGHDNVFVADGSLHVTNGGFNPVLTILALAHRVASNILKVW